MERRQLLAGLGLTALATGIGLAIVPRRQGSRRRKASPLRQSAFPPLQEYQRMQQLQSVPYSCVEQLPDRTIYSREVNQITCAALAGRVEWVGTRYGIKRVDRRRDELQLYTPEDGLPGRDVLQVAGDEHEGFALVRCADGAVAFCHLPSGKDRWVTLHRRPQPPQSPVYVTRWQPAGKESLVMNDEVAVFVPAALSARGENTAPYYVFQRHAGKLTAAPWDPVVKADHPQVRVTCAFLSQGQLWMGSDIGLLAAPLRFENEVAWRRFLPELAVQAGAPLADSTLALLVTQREEQANPRALTTIAFDPKKAARTALPSLPVPTFPELVTEEGSLYLVPPPPNPRTLHLGQETEPVVWRLAPGRVAWERVVVATSPARPGMPPFAPFGPLPTLADTKTVPDPVALALVLQNGYTPSAARGIDGGERRLALLWLHLRFPRWLSPDARAELPPEFARTPIPLGQHTLVDPDAADTVWKTEGEAFVQVKNGAPVRFPIATAGTRRSIPVGRLLAGAALIVVPDGAALSGPLLVPATGAPGPAAFAPPESRFGTRTLAAGAVSGPDRTVFVWDFTEKTLRAWDPTRQQLVPTSIAFQSDGYGLIGGTSAGLWRRTNQALLLQALGPGGVPRGTWQEVSVPLATNNQPPMVVGDLLWFRVLEGGKNNLVGWDPARRVTTAPSPTLNSTSGGAAGDDGTLWFTDQSKEQALLGYDPKTDRWERIPSPETEPLYGKVLIANAYVVWVLSGQGFWRWDRQARRWDRPEEAQRWPHARGNGMDLVSSAPAADGHYWIGSTRGLWRFDPVGLHWEEKTVAGAPGNGADTLNLELLTRDAVWARSGSLLARLDRASGRARLYGRESGGPTSAYGRLSPADNTVWVLVHGGDPVLRFDPGTQRFAPPPGLGTERVMAVAPDPTDSHRALVASLDREAPLVRWDNRTRRSEPVSVPKEAFPLYDLQTRGSVVYAASPSGVWRFVVGAGSWTRVVDSGVSAFRPDPMHADVLWATGEETIVRLVSD